MKLAKVIVLYNEKIEKEAVDLYYFDNSDDVDIIAYNNNFKSNVPMNGNVGLSKAYNQAILKFQDSYDYLMILDDDSKLDDTFDLQLYEYLSQNFDFLLPEIISHRTQNISYPKYMDDNPCIYYFEKLFRITKPKKIKTINSGLIINLNNNPELFDETLFIYSVDFEYCRRVVSSSNYKIIPLKLYQNFSREGDDMLEVLSSTRLLRNDALSYYSKVNFLLNFSIKYCALAFRFRSIKPLRELFDTIKMVII